MRTLITLKGISLSRGGRTVLRTVDLEVAAGEVVALIGPNGAGKSTLLQTAAGALTPEAGEIVFEDQPLNAWKPVELARRRAVMSQRSGLSFGLTGFEVALLGRAPHHPGAPRPQDRAVAEAALSVAGAEALIDRHWTELSGGERQRVQLARALAQVWPTPSTSAGLLMLDEPTAAQDLKHQHALLDVAQAFADAGGGVLVVLHDLNLAAARADRLALMHDGTLVACGPPETVLTPHRLEAVYGVPVQTLPRPDGRGLMIYTPMEESP